MATFSGQARQWKGIPVFREYGTPGLTCCSDLNQDVLHEFSLLLVDAFLEGSFNIGGKFIRTFYTALHGRCCRWIISY